MNYNELKDALHAESQKLRNQRKILEGVLESVNTFTGKVINKRLCTHIEKDAPRYWQGTTRWNSETKVDETKQESFPTYRTSLEVKSYNKTMHIMTRVYAENQTVWFTDIENLKANLKARIEAQDESIGNFMTLEKNLPEIIERYEKASKEINDISNTPGMYPLRDWIKGMGR